MCRLSVITVNRNNAEGLRKTMESVFSQTYHDFEYILVDGASTDESVEVIREYVHNGTRLNEQTSDGIHIQWASERDCGVYDAMNRGGVKAAGEYLYFLNSGDTLSSLSIISEIIDLLDGSDILVGRVNITHKGCPVDTTKLLSEQDMSLYNMYLHGINHQSAIIKRDLLIKVPYDISLRYGADWKFFVQTIVIGGSTTKFVNMIFANYDDSGISSDTISLRKEREMILDTIVPERIARDYHKIAPHYYEVVRVRWLLEHPFWYKIYRLITTFARKISNS